VRIIVWSFFVVSKQCLAVHREVVVPHGSMKKQRRDPWSVPRLRQIAVRKISVRKIKDRPR